MHRAAFMLTMALSSMAACMSLSSLRRTSKRHRLTQQTHRRDRQPFNGGGRRPLLGGDAGVYRSYITTSASALLPIQLRTSSSPATAGEPSLDSKVNTQAELTPQASGTVPGAQKKLNILRNLKDDRPESA